MAGAAYKLVLANSSFTPQDEIKQFGSFQFTRSLNKLATLSFQVRIDNPLGLSLSAADRYVKAYRNNVLVFVGPIISAVETAERSTQTIAITCADAGWTLSKRLAGKSGTGTLFSTVTDRAQIAKTLIDTTNTEAATGITTANYAQTAGSAITYKAGPYRKVLEAVQELGNALDGFDWRIHPVENWVNGALSGVNIGAIQMAPVIYAQKPNAVFEYGPGTRSNVLSYSKARTRDGQANRVFHLGNDPATPNTGNNSAAQTTWGLLEDVAQADITDATMRQKLVDEHVAVRGNPRDLISVTPHIDPGVTGRLPLPFVDYDVGDEITFRAVANKVVRFSGALRVYAINVTVDQETGFERVTLTLEDE
jgi:hypothetical protein